MATPTLVAEDWTVDPLEPKGAEQLYRRMHEAEPRRVRRTELEGHVGLTARELYELGCTLAPLDARRVGGMVGWRVAVVAGVLIAGLGLALTVAAGFDVLGIERGDDDPPRDLATNVGLVGFFLAFGYGGLALMRLGIRRLRALAAARRRAEKRVARNPIDDPQGRATVATLRGPGVIRVQLLWLRGDPRNPSYVEVRTLAERSVEEDDAGRAEDAVAAFSETAVRADNAHALRHQGGLAALGLRRRRKRQGERASAPRSESRDDERGPPREVGLGWEPEPLTEAGQAEIARRLVTAPVERWSATSLGPLLVEDASGLDEPPEWPAISDRRPTQLELRRATRFIAWCGFITFVFALISGEDSTAPTAEAVRIGLAGLAVALVAGLVPRIVAKHRPHVRLTRAARAAAARAPRALEQGLPGTAGLFRVARGRGQIALLHVRPARDDGQRGELEVRKIATRTVADDDLDAVTTFCSIASDANLRSEGVGRSAGRVRSLAARLATRRAGEPALWREPLAWVAAILVGVLLAASVKHTLAGTWFEHGVAHRVIGFSWLLVAAYLALHAARRVRDPFSLDA